MGQKIRQIICLLAGLFILALGIALSRQSGLGVGPTSSLPLVLSQLLPFSMGAFNMIINVLFVLIQIAILRKNYRPVYLFQLAVAFAFSYFLDLTVQLVSFIRVDAYWAQLILLIVSCVVMAVGVFMEVRAGLITMATEGFLSAVSDVFHIDFGTAKMILDWGMIAVSAIISLAAWHTLVGVREGTVIAAFLVGYIVRFFNKHATFIYPLLGFAVPGKEELSLPADAGRAPLVITIEREWGSGGHEIGERLANELGISFYDYAVISETAEETGLEPSEIRRKEQTLGYGLVYSIYNSSISTTQIMSEQEQIFEAQKKVIRKMASEGSCVIVGRLGSYVLREHPNAFHMFITASEGFRTGRISGMMEMDFKSANELRKKEDAARHRHCRYFTGEPWGLAKHYALTLDTSQYGVDRALEIIREAIELRETHMTLSR